MVNAPPMASTLPSARRGVGVAAGVPAAPREMHDAANNKVSTPCLIRRLFLGFGGSSLQSVDFKRESFLRIAGPAAPHPFQQMLHTFAELRGNIRRKVQLGNAE